MKKIRLDQLLVQRRLVESREQARKLVRAGLVRVDDRPADKPGHLYAPDANLFLKERPRYVSRGGLKLEGAHRAFGFDLSGAVCLDVGASTGGFTDFMLQRGANKVYAVDCGTNQLHYRLRIDPRVISMENLNARYLAKKDVPEPIDFCAIDVSFISLTLVLPPLEELMKPGGRIVSLVKPQFEAGRESVGKGGVVRDPAIREATLEKVRRFGTETLGFEWIGHCVSPIKGPAGNVEFLACWNVPGKAPPASESTIDRNPDE